MDKNILVTGGAGFIGSQVCQSFVANDYNVLTIDNLSTGFEENVPNGVELIYGDCSDDTVLKKLNNYEFEAIIHIAGQSSGEISFEDPEYDLRSNTLSTINLLKLCKETICKKFIYASTMSVYGDTEIPVVDESSKVNPKSFYAVGKLASENYMQIYSNMFGISCMSLRLFNCYGIGQNMDNLKQGMVSIFLAMALRREKVIVKGSKNRFRDFVHVKDVVNAFNKALTTDFGLFQILNISTNRKTTVEELINLITDNLPYDVEVNYKGQTPGDQFGIYGNNTKANNLLGWEPMIKIEDGIKEVVQYYLEMKNS